jgi:hypothetical protein
MNSKSNFDNKIYTQVYYLHVLFGEKLDHKRFFLDTYFGFSVREKYEKVILEPFSKNYSPIVIYKDFLPYAYSGVFLVNKISLHVIHSIQLGVNIGIQSK